MLKIFLCTVALLIGISAPFQVIAEPNQMDETIEISKNAIPEKRKAYIAEVIQLKGPEAIKFWSMYDSYTKELSKVTDQSYGLLDQYARAYREDKMTDGLAARLMKKHFKLKKLKNKVTEKHLENMSDAFSETLAMRFLQAEEKMDTIIKYSYQFDIPLVEFK